MFEVAVAYEFAEVTSNLGRSYLKCKNASFGLIRGMRLRCRANTKICDTCFSNGFF